MSEANDVREREDAARAPGRPGDTAPDSGEGAATSSTSSDAHTKLTVWIALAANLVIAVAKLVGGLFAGSPALLSEAAHSVADSLNEVFLLAALRRSKRPADPGHPFGYGKERYFWSLLAAVGIFVMGGCFSVFQGVEALRSSEQESTSGYIVGLIVLGVALLAEGTSLARALLQVRGQEGGIGSDPALRTVVAEDGTAVLGVLLAIAGMVLHMTTGQVVYEAAASLAIGVLLLFVAFKLGADARDQLIGEGADPDTREAITAYLDAQPEIDGVATLLTMRLGQDSLLVAARVDLTPGHESEKLELVMERVKAGLTERWPEADQVFLDVTEAPEATKDHTSPDLTA
ncbi:cation diffusion facilitator family transporter [Streptomyces sp. NRRL F-5630]|uniref:cation diffusion facilitator family transporter n=1 Tax=Streptomyces sp. NRRL F-5630 TaxID=1463864 RepID=UPI003D703CCE